METPSLDDVLALERAVWQALVSGDPAADREALSPDFLGVYKDGLAGREAHAGQLADGPTVLTYRIEDARLLPLAPGVVLLAYLALYEPAARPGTESAMYVSSIWRRDGETWSNIFSQDTDRED